MEQVNYYGILPANVRYCKTVSSSAKVLYSELTALCRDNGYCANTNQYFADLFGFTKGTISELIAELVYAGFVHTSIENNYIRKIYLTDSYGGL